MSVETPYRHLLTITAMLLLVCTGMAQQLPVRSHEMRHLSTGGTSHVSLQASPGMTGSYVLRLPGDTVHAHGSLLTTTNQGSKVLTTSWLPAGVNGSVLSIVNGTPAWSQQALSLSGVEQQVGFFGSTTTMRGSASFLYDSTAKRLTLTAASARTPSLRIVRDGSVTAADTVLQLRSSTTGGPLRTGMLIDISGSADTSVGLVSNVSGATNNFAALLLGRVGINTRAPAAELDVNGAVAYRQRGHTVTTTGPHHNVDFGSNNDRSYVHITGTITSQSTWTGFAGGRDGKMLWLTNATGENMVIAHNSTSSSSANRIRTVDGNNLIITPGATANFVYSIADSAWRVTSISPLSISAFSNYSSNTVTSGETLPSSTTAYIKLIPSGNVGNIYLEDGAVTGQILVVQNSATGNGNKFTLAGTNISVGSTSSTLSGGEALFMVWDGTQWQTIARKGT